MTTKRELTKGRLRRLRPWVVVYIGAVAVVGVVAGIVWNRVIDLPSYEIGVDYRATIPESSLSQIAAIDVWFSFFGVVGGLILGISAWVLFRRLGWVVTVIAAVGGVLAGLVARLVGEFIGPSNFSERIAQATRGELVSVDFTARTWVPLAIWVGMAVLPVLIGSLVQRQEWISHTPQTGHTAETADDELG